MKRGDVWWVDFDPSLGGEIQKTRPAVIISNDIANWYLNRVQVIPRPSQVNRLYPSEAYVTLHGKQSKAMADRIMTVSKLRLTTQAGELSQSDMRQVERVIAVQLGLRA